MECLDEETILAFCQGGLTPVARARAEAHVASCDECRALVSAVARSSIVSVAPPRQDGAMAPTTPVGDVAQPAPVEAPVAPGEVLAGKYEVERVLGAGGMGVVVAARHRQLDQRVALKFLLPAACHVPGAVARFLREGKAAARITSEHVARVTDTGVLDGGAPYLVMEYLEGRDLGAVLRERGRLGASEAVAYVLQACEAIVEAHELGVVHRDLKPANLFLSRRADGSPLVKVLDFGISKIEGQGTRSQLTSATALMGSPRYMSPEQMVSAKDVDARTDVWALGIILFELVTGRPVWDADTVQGLCALVASAPAPRLRALAPDAPSALEGAVARCLEKARDQRLASVADLALALAPIAPPEAATSIERIVRVAGRAGPGSIAPVGPMMAGGAAAPGSATGDGLSAEARAHEAPARARRVRLALAGVAGLLVVTAVALDATRPWRDGPEPTPLVSSPPPEPSAGGGHVAVAPPAEPLARVDEPVADASVAPPAESAESAPAQPVRRRVAKPRRPARSPAPAPSPDRALSERK